MRDEGVQQVASCSCSVGGLGFSPWSIVVLFCHGDYYVSGATTGTGESEGRGGQGCVPFLRCLLARLPPRHRFSWQIASKPIQVLRKTVTRRLVFGLCTPLVALLVYAVCLAPRQYTPTTRIPALLKSPRMKLTAPIVDKCLVRDGEDHHPASLTCAAGSLGREERSALLFSSPPAAGYPGRSICIERRALRAKALNLPSL